MVLLKVKISRFFCSHTFNSSYHQDLNSINFLRNPFTVFFNDFADSAYLMKLKEIEQPNYYIKNYKQ